MLIPRYARASELLKHSEMIGRQYGLYERTLFQTEVGELRWDENSALWSVKTSRGDDIKARFVIPSAGPLHRPKLPGVKGIEDFKGHSFHSSRWDYGYTGGDNGGGLTGLKDKRVAVIGTGATGKQQRCRTTLYVTLIASSCPDRPKRSEVRKRAFRLPTNSLVGRRSR